jgi:cholesterol oxidase
VHNPPVPTAFDYDFAVIGSGFGGSVSALRLSEKGHRVVVLEMGKRYRPGDFAVSNWDIRKFLWLPLLKLHGIQQITLLKGLFILHGAGVGGGSLVYANTLPHPTDEAFQDPHWPKGIDWKAHLARHYQEARRMLGAVRAPRVFPADLMLKEAVEEETGRGATFRTHDVAVFTGEPGVEVADPYFGGEGPARTGCNYCGSCMTGCRVGAKNTLDKNYLHLAEARGCRILPETRVTDVRPLEQGGYEVDLERSTAWFSRNRRTLRVGGVILAGGAIGTTRLLLECRERGSLPRLSSALGDFVRTNSEALVGALAPRVETDFSEGMAITSGIDADEHTHMEIVRYGKGHDFMGTMVTRLTGGEPPWPRWLRWLGGVLRHPLQTLRAHDVRDWARRTIIILVMQPISSWVRMRLAWRPWGRVLKSEFSGGATPPTYLPIANRIATRLAGKVSGTPGNLLLEVLNDRSSTAHILGGAIMADDPSRGVCDAQGRVFGHPGLYVADGALVPANLGVNPALTITALAEHVMSGIAAKDAASTEALPAHATAGTA